MEFRQCILAKKYVVKIQRKLMDFPSFTRQQLSAPESTLCCYTDIENFIFQGSTRLSEIKSGIVSCELEVSGTESRTLAPRIPRLYPLFLLAVLPFGFTDSGQSRPHGSRPLYTIVTEQFAK
jgi:hypothetical protein